jgi:hypothetical protein
MRPRTITMLITTAAMAAVCASGADSTLAAIYFGRAPLFLTHIRGAIATDTRRSA